MKHLALIAAMTLASATAMAQTTTGNTATTSGKTAQEANAAKSGTKAADAGQSNANATGAQSGTSTMGATNAAGTKAGRWAAMDANKDGMVSQEEYMAFHTSHWGKMKHTNGMVSMAEMEAAMSGGTAGGPN